MPNIKSVMKNDVKSKLQNAKNRAEKTAMKTSLKKFDAAVNAGDKDAAAATFKAAVQSVDRAAGILRSLSCTLSLSAFSNGRVSCLLLWKSRQALLIERIR